MAIKDKQRLYNQGNEIYNETAKGANTAGRVGAMHIDTIDTMFALRRPAVFVNAGNLCVDLGGNNYQDGDMYLQIVHFNKKTKMWHPASGAGVTAMNFFGTVINAQQAAIPNASLIRCKYPLTKNLTSFDFNDSTQMTELFDYLFIPYYKLRYYSFKQLFSTKWVNVHTNTIKLKTSYHRYALKKMGLAVTKFVSSEQGAKSFIVSDIYRFTMFANDVRDELQVNLKNSHVINHPVAV